MNTLLPAWAPTFNHLGVAMLWCLLQVTLVVSCALAAAWLCRRVRSAACVPVMTAAAAAVIVLSLLAASPYPRWSEVVASSVAERNVSPVAATPVALEHGAQVPPEAAASAPPGGYWSDFWSNLKEEIKLPAVSAAPAHEGWRWSGWLAIAVIAMAALALVRLGLGFLAVRSLRRRSQPIHDESLRALAGDLCRLLEIRGEIQFLESSDLTAPATLGWRRPMVLLPSDWRRWSTMQLRTVLAHELAHVRNRDYLAGMLAQIGVALHFYHPLMHILARKLRLEIELNADADALRAGIPAQTYLRTLAHMALQNDRRSPGWPARAFLPTRGTLLRRIEMLKDVTQLARRSGARPRVAWSLLVLTVALAAAGLRGVAQEDAPIKPRQLQPNQVAATLDDKLTASWVPADAMGIVIVRPSSIASSEYFAPLARTVDNLLTEQMGVSLGNLRQVTGVLLANPQGGHSSGPGGAGAYILEFTEKPADTTKLLGEGGAAETKKFAGHQYTLSHGRAACWSDDRTLIVGGEGDVQQMLLSGKKSRSPLVSGESWESLQNSHVVLAVSGDALRYALSGVRDDERIILAPATPLIEQTAGFRAGLQLGEKTSINLIVECSAAEDKKDVADTLAAMITLGRNSVKQVKKALPDRGPAMERVIMARVLEMADQALHSAKVEDLSEKSVRLSATASVSPEMLAVASEGLFAMRRAAQRAVGQNNLKQIAIAMHNYADTYKHFPPAVLTSKDGNKTQPYSWRVAILPYLEQAQLYNQYRFNEPWDSENNKLVLAQMPAVYRAPGDKPGSTFTSYFGLVGKGTIFSRPEGARFADITDGTSNTLMFVESKQDTPWTKPEDIVYSPDEAIPAMGGWYPGYFNVALCDGSVRSLSDKIDEVVLRAIISMQGGEIVNIHDENAGHARDAVAPGAAATEKATAPAPLPQLSDPPRR